MMPVHELFRRLSLDELSNMGLVKDANGTIKKEQQNKIVHFANEGLKDLHLRFLLRQRDLIITTSDEEQIIPLDEDVIDIIAIINAYGVPVSFSTSVRPGQFYVHNRKLNVPACTEVQELMVNYHIRHPTLNPIGSDADLEQNIKLAPELQPALTAFIAAEMYRTMNSADGMAVSNNYKNRYEELCAKAISYGVVPSDTQYMSKFDQRGFV